MDLVLTLPELAALLRVSPRRLRARLPSLHAAGLPRPLPVGRPVFSRLAVESWLEAGAAPPPASNDDWSFAEGYRRRLRERMAARGAS